MFQLSVKCRWPQGQALQDATDSCNTIFSLLRSLWHLFNSPTGSPMPILLHKLRNSEDDAGICTHSTPVPSSAPFLDPTCCHNPLPLSSSPASITTSHHPAHPSTLPPPHIPPLPAITPQELLCHFIKLLEAFATCSEEQQRRLKAPLTQRLGWFLHSWVEAVDRLDAVNPSYCQLLVRQGAGRTDCAVPGAVQGQGEGCEVGGMVMSCGDAC
jgi:hypothetical protein